MISSPAAFWALIGASLGLLGSGCARFVAKPLDPADSATAVMSRRLPARLWTLESLAAEAAHSQPEVVVARTQYETARAALVTAGESPNPSVAISPRIPVEMRDYLTGTYSIDFDWTVETAGKRSHRLEVAHANVRSSAERLADTIWKARGSVRKAMLDLYAGEERERLFEAAVTQEAELLAILDRRIEAGEESRIVGFQPRLLLAQIRLQSADASRNEAVARAGLAEALGLSVDGLTGARFSFSEFERPIATTGDHRRTALTHRADILAALAEYAAAEGSLRLEIAKQYPDVHLNPGYELDANRNKWSIGVGLTLPILNQNQGAIGEAEAKRKEAAAHFHFVQSKALAECERASLALKSARQKLSVADDLLAQEGKQVESEKRLVDAGASDKVGWRSAAVEQTLQRVARLDAWVEYQAAVGAMEDATESRLP